MAARQMDATFRYRLRRMTQAPFASPKALVRYLLYELPSLFSAYKGLLKGKDRLSENTELVRSICQYISLMLKQNKRTPSVAALCDRFGLSNSRLQRLFQLRLGISPLRYMLRHKMEMIAQVLVCTDSSLLDIALEYGYSDTNALNKIFKRYMGCTLTHYRSKR